METRRPEQRGMMVVGGMLLVVGVLALAGRAFGIDAFEVGWPLLVIVPGLLMFALAVATGGRAGSAIAVPAGIVTMTGFVRIAMLWASESSFTRTSANGLSAGSRSSDVSNFRSLAVTTIAPGGIDGGGVADPLQARRPTATTARPIAAAA